MNSAGTSTILRTLSKSTSNRNKVTEVEVKVLRKMYLTACKI